MNTYKFAVAVALAMASGSAMAEVLGSKHDMSVGAPSAAYNVDSGNTQVCVFCHTPHRSVNQAGKPLWNHDASTVTSYTMYDSTTMNAADVTTPGGESLACLTCHDGSVAVNALVNDPGGTAGTATAAWIDAVAKVGNATQAGLTNDLSKDHPIGITYPTTDAGLELAATVDASDLELFGGAELRVECATCHDVHNETSVVGTNYAFLRVTEADSEICTTCHLK